VSSNVMENASDVRCPRDPANEYVIGGSPTVYTLSCPEGGPADFPHGSVIDGIVSWQND